MARAADLWGRVVYTRTWGGDVLFDAKILKDRRYWDFRGASSRSDKAESMVVDIEEFISGLEGEVVVSSHNWDSGELVIRLEASDD